MRIIFVVEIFWYAPPYSDKSRHAKIYLATVSIFMVSDINEMVEKYLA